MEINLIRNVSLFYTLPYFLFTMKVLTIRRLEFKGFRHDVSLRNTRARYQYVLWILKITRIALDNGRWPVFFIFLFVVDTILSSNDIDTNTKWKIDRRCFVEANSLNLNFEWMKGKCARDSRLRSNSHRSDRDHGRTIVRRSRILSRFVEVSLEGVSLHENRSCTLSTTTNLFYF